LRILRENRVAFPISSALLESLPLSERTSLFDDYEFVSLPLRTVLFEAEEKPRYLHFITSGLASVVTEMADGRSIEVSLLGREGLPGCAHLLGPQAGAARCFMQVGGSGVRVEIEKLEQAFMKHPVFHQRVLQHVQYEYFTQSQLLACNSTHEVEPRLARWLLMAEDRLGEPAVSLTHEFLGEMLGVQRPTVSLVAKSLKEAGLIRYTHGTIELLNRSGLEKVACECYKTTQKWRENLYVDGAVTTFDLTAA
jgi:CRP-like cAMP-binding protein